MSDPKGVEMSNDPWWEELLKECDETETEPTGLQQAIAMHRNAMLWNEAQAEKKVAAS